uniref:Chitin-binding type-2 domain-containing protein n=1 Tax=Glossina brevipalpis TaxID=37001 RepID=A0A1A9WJG2_9MUSC
MNSLQFSSFACLAVLFTIFIKEQVAGETFQKDITQACARGYPSGNGKYTIENGPRPEYDPCTWPGPPESNYYLKCYHGEPKALECRQWIHYNKDGFYLEVPNETPPAEDFRTNSYKEPTIGMLDDLIRNYKATTIVPTTVLTTTQAQSSTIEPPLGSKMMVAKSTKPLAIFGATVNYDPHSKQISSSFNVEEDVNRHSAYQNTAHYEVGPMSSIKSEIKRRMITEDIIKKVSDLITLGQEQMPIFTKCYDFSLMLLLINQLLSSVWTLIVITKNGEAFKTCAGLSMRKTIDSEFYLIFYFLTLSKCQQLTKH